MARLTADFIPLDSTDIFDMTGEMPPQLRVYFHVPPEYQEVFFQIDTDMTSEERKVWYENQNDLKEVIIALYRGKAQTRLAGIRQNKNIAIIGHYRQEVELDTGVMMEYTSLWGREYVSLIFDERLTRKLLEKLGINVMCLLVLYETDKIMAFTMAQVYKDGKLDKPIYKTALNMDKVADSQKWEKNHYYCNMQETLAPGSIFTNSCFDFSARVKANVPVVMPNWSLITTQGMKVVYDTAEPFDFDALIVNGKVDGTGDSKKLMLYGLMEQFTYTYKGSKFEKGPDYPDPPAGSGEATAVTVEGERKFLTTEGKIDDNGNGSQKFTYWFMQSKVTSINKAPKVDPPTQIFKIGTHDSKKEYVGDEVTQTIASTDFIDTNPATCPNGAPLYLKTTTHPIERANTRNTFDGEVTYYGHYVSDGVTKLPNWWISTTVNDYGPIDLSVRYLDGSINWAFATAGGGTTTGYGSGMGDPPDDGGTINYFVGHNTSVLFVEPNADNVFTTEFDALVQDPAQLAIWKDIVNNGFCQFHHISSNTSYQTIPGGETPNFKFQTDVNKTVTPYYFPYAVEDKIYAQKANYPESGGSDITLKTPFEDINLGHWDYSSPDYFPWLNLHDGAVLVQGCYLEDWRSGGSDPDRTFYLYVNGNRVEKIENVELKDVRTIYIDVPFNVIRRWATKKS